MDANKLLKKLEEIKVDAFNNLSSSEKDSSLQVESETEFELDEDAKGEDVKIERTKGEKYKLPDTLSRTTPMAGPTKHNPSEKVYVTDGTLKSTREKLDDFKQFLQINKFKNVDSDGNPFEPRTPEEEWFRPDESSLLAAIDLIRQRIEDLEDMPDHMKDGKEWFAEVEHAKVELKQLEDQLANLDNPDWKPFKKNDPMTTAQMILEEGPKNDKEAEIHLLLRDAHGKNDEASVRQVLMMLPQGM